MKNNNIAIVRVNGKTKNIVVKTPQNMAHQDLMPMFVNHLGVDNRISLANLFKKVYGVTEKEAKAKLYFMKKALAMGRAYAKKHTDCKIISRYYAHDEDGMPGKTWYCFIPTTMDEALYHKKELKTKEKGFRKSAANIVKYVKNKGHKKYLNSLK